MTVDTVDRRIVSVLNAEGRINNNEIAAKLGISEGTVRNRIRKLTEAGLLRVAGLINPDDSLTVTDNVVSISGVILFCANKWLFNVTNKTDMMN